MWSKQSFVECQSFVGSFIRGSTIMHVSSCRFANNKIVRVYSLVLADFSKNTDLTNHAVVKMLYRISVQLNMTPLLYQISIFRTLLAILSEPPVPRLQVRASPVPSPAPSLANYPALMCMQQGVK